MEPNDIGASDLAALLVFLVILFQISPTSLLILIRLLPLNFIFKICQHVFTRNSWEPNVQDANSDQLLEGEVTMC